MKNKVHVLVSLKSVVVSVCPHALLDQIDIMDNADRIDSYELQQISKQRMTVGALAEHTRLMEQDWGVGSLTPSMLVSISRGHPSSHVDRLPVFEDGRKSAQPSTGHEEHVAGQKEIKSVAFATSTSVAVAKDKKTESHILAAEVSYSNRGSRSQQCVVDNAAANPIILPLSTPAGKDEI